MQASNEENEATFEITVYKENKQFKKLSIKLNASNSPIEIIMEKDKNNNEVQYKISLNAGQGEIPQIQVAANYSGLENLSTVQEKYDIEVNSSLMAEEDDVFSYIYTYNNSVNFVENVDIEELDEENTVILNKQKEDYVANLMGAIGERLQQVNSKLMQEIDFEENENPITYLIPGVGQAMLAGTSSTENQIDELEVTSFNQKFEVYESTNTRGATVKGLLSTIQANNETEEQEYKIEEINFDGQEYEVTEQNITLLKSEIDVEDNYKVEFEKDDDTGIIFRAVINKK